MSHNNRTSYKSSANQRDLALRNTPPPIAERHYHVADLILGTRRDAQSAAYHRLKDRQRELRVELGQDWRSYAREISQFIASHTIVECELACI